MNKFKTPEYTKEDQIEIDGYLKLTKPEMAFHMLQANKMFQKFIDMGAENDKIEENDIETPVPPHGGDESIH